MQHKWICALIGECTGEGPTEGIQGERFGSPGNIPATISNLLEKHLAGAGLDLPSELSCKNFCCLGHTLVPISDNEHILRAHKGHLSSLGRTQAEGHCTMVKLTGLCFLHPGFCTTHWMPWCLWASAFWDRISGEQEWKELNFDREKPLNHWHDSQCIPKWNQINLKAQQPAQSSHKRVIAIKESFC